MIKTFSKLALLLERQGVASIGRSEIDPRDVNIMLGEFKEDRP